MNCCTRCCCDKCCCCHDTGSEQEKPTSPELEIIPQAETECVCKVLFTSIEVLHEGEKSSGEWELELNVNGRRKTWSKDEIVQKNYNLDIEFTLSSCNSPIQIKICGWEKDYGKPGRWYDFVRDTDDPLPEILVNHLSPSKDESVLKTYAEIGKARGIDASYRIYYEILRVCKEIKAISKSEIISAVSNKHTKSKATETEILSEGLNIIKKAGWELKGITNDVFIFEGIPNKKRG